VPERIQRERGRRTEARAGNRGAVEQPRIALEERDTSKEAGKGTKSPFDQIRRHLRSEAVSRRLRRARETYTVNTRRTIEKALRNLEELADEAHTRATSKYLPTEDKQKWTRIEAYIYQTVNGLTKTRDNQEIMDRPLYAFSSPISILPVCSPCDLDPTPRFTTGSGRSSSLKNTLDNSLS
jgi:hypothetical protein